ncbi:alpha/beta fold hydrolase [Gloeothece verrucosa]|uniref:Alpha/beta hydrolase fold protein n=1 Tax=Gloeothece verrucosa (strain PCC 7822) TaxID=497965 RepID=E0UBH1_GLOV7|nr:alpha/beta hydrolase [Gloeothece verrucosa]ADN12803.1 alpha/beta hydrolase fold protein [Gloeothece verrucosa PCC 7822]
MNLNTEIKGLGYPILCLHGHPGSGRSLSVFTNHLSQHYQTIAPDLRGYGKSRSKGDFQMEDHLTDLESLLDRLKVERCLLLGWSLGGILALELALRNPQRYDGLILIAAAARPRGNHPPISWQDLVFSGVAGIINGIKPGWQWNIETFGVRSLFRYLISQQTPLAYQYIASDGVLAYLQTSKAAERALYRALRSGYNRLDALHQLTLPCLVLAGANDVHITAASSEETAQAIKQCQWRCYPNTAHLFPWEVPDQVLKDIDTWLKTLGNNYSH